MSLDHKGTPWSLPRYMCFAQSLLMVACHHAPPPAAPPAPPPAPPPVVEQPPPPPKCEQLEEGCIAKQGQKARLYNSPWSLDPPVDWTYAQGARVVATRETSILAVTLQPVGATKQDKLKRDEIFTGLVTELKVTLPKKKFVWPKKPDQLLEAGALKVALYQVDVVTRDGKKGPLLLFSAVPEQGDGLLGAGFVADDDATNADQAILGAIRSLDREAPPPSSQP